MDFYYHGVWRMDWGLGNPNKTATLIACLMMAVWLAACVWRRGFWVALAISIPLGWCLVQTYSRGGMLALVAGIAVLLAGAPRPWPRARMIAAVGALWFAAAFIFCAKAESRYSQGLFSDDPSIGSRLVVWKHFPEMLAAAPWGWGWGRAGDAYTQWFQPADQSINYLNLLNSHLTAMAEGGWLFSLFYIAAWLAMMMLCWPVRKERMRAVPMAVWIAFGVGGFFSQVEDSPWLWMLPLFVLGVVLYARFQERSWPNPGTLGVGGVLPLAAVVVIIGVGQATAILPIRVEKQAVVVGNGEKRTIVYIDREVMGKLYGHTFRKFLEEGRAHAFGRTYIITEAPECLVPAGVSQVVLSGRMVNEVKMVPGRRLFDEVILINPACLPGEMGWNAGVAAKTRVLFGEYSDVPSRSSWESCSSVRYLAIDGAGDFVPAWPSAVWEPAGI